MLCKIKLHSRLSLLGLQVYNEIIEGSYMKKKNYFIHEQNRAWQLEPRCFSVKTTAQIPHNFPLHWKCSAWITINNMQYTILHDENLAAMHGTSDGHINSSANVKAFVDVVHTQLNAFPSNLCKAGFFVSPNPYMQ